MQVPQGYIRGQNIHGAPYDFRRAANEHGGRPNLCSFDYLNLNFNLFGWSCYLDIISFTLQGNTSAKWKDWLRRLLSGTIKPRWFLFATGKTRRSLMVRISTSLIFSDIKYYLFNNFNNISFNCSNCHSMGSIMMHYFLQQQTPAWKEKHIRWDESDNFFGEW